MKPILVLLLLFGCATLTEQEQFDRDYKEADRKNLYIMWESECLANKGVVYSYDVSSVCRSCIPHRRDWSYNSKLERRSMGNRVVCISQRQLDGTFR